MSNKKQAKQEEVELLEMAIKGYKDEIGKLKSHIVCLEAILNEHKIYY